MYTSGIKYTRSPEENNNQIISWARSDKAFFASGACHILAYTFKSLYPDRNLKLIYIKPDKKFGLTGTHMYVLDGEWAFDFNGWSKEADLLRVTEKSYKSASPGWGYEKIKVEVDLETFCKENSHRSPAYFAHLPWERTHAFISQFDAFPSE